MKGIIALLVTVLSMGLQIVLTAQAQTQIEGAAFEFNSQIVHDDNIFRVQDKESDTFIKLSPTFAYKGLYGKHQLTTAYEGDYALYTNNSSVNYNNHKAMANLELGLTSKWNMSLGLLYLNQVEQPGINNQVLNDVNEFNQFSRTRFNIRTAYGRTSSTGQLVFNFARHNYDYKNNNQAYRDRSQSDVSGTFYWRIAPKSRMIFEVRAADVNSDNTLGFNQTFEQLSYLTGVTWEATGKTEGAIRVGYQDTNYENPLIADLDGLSYFADIDWRPDTNSIVTLALSRTARDNPELVLAGLETTDFSLRYETPIIGNFDLAVKYSYRNDKFGGGSSARSDKTNAIKGEISYSAYSWLDVFVGLEHMMRNSENTIYEFDNNRISIGAIVAFD